MAMVAVMVGASSAFSAQAAAPAATPASVGHTYRHGAVPPLGSASSPGAQPASAPASGTGVLKYGGGNTGGGSTLIGVTTGPPKVYLVFWGSQWGSAATNGQGYTTLSADSNGMAPDLQAFMAGLGTGGELWSGVMTQYCEGVGGGATSCAANNTHVGYPSGGALAGVWADTGAAAPASATGKQLATEAVSAAGHFGNTTAASNRNTQYFIVSPHGTTPDGFNTASGNFCAWHDFSTDPTLPGGAATSPYGPVAFTNMPYVTDAGSSCGMNFVNTSTGTLDGVTIVGGHEYAETITDQFPSGGWLDTSGEENGDKCAWIQTGAQAKSQNITLTTGTFAVQSTYSNDVTDCQVSHAIVGPVVSDFSISANPTSVTVAQGSSATTTINTAVTSGSAQTVTLSASGLPGGATAAFNPTSVTAGQSSTLTISAGSAAVGSSTVTVTGSATSGSHTASVSVSVTAPQPNDFSIGASPTTVGTAAGGSGTTLVSTNLTSGSAQSIALSATGLPAGATASFNPASVNSGGSSTLTINTLTSTPVATSTVTITGTGTSATHTTTVSLTVTAAGSGQAVTNGGFEAGSFSGWTTSGASETLVSPGHTGTKAARLGAPTPTNGNSTMQQTITVPTNASLTFWYQPFCPDTLTYDQQQVQVRNPAGTTLATVLNVCDNSGTWKTATASLASFAGQSVVLWFNSHDDNYAADPTYVNFDDISVTGTATTNDFSMAAAPTSVSVVQGSSGTSTISTAVTSGSAQSVALSAAGLPSGASASFNPATVNAGSSSVMTITTLGSTPAATSTITVTGTGSSATHTTSVSLTVTAPQVSDFSVTASPGSVSVVQGSSAGTTISAPVVSGAAQSVALSASGQPVGATVSFNPTSITSGGAGATMTIATSVTTTAGSYTITVTGTGTSATHSTTVSLTVTAPGANAVTNGTFETGSFSGWATSGASFAVAAPGHSGSYSARLGASTPTNGNSTMQQTITVPANASLTFWYQPHCPDTLTYDQQQVQIRNPAGTTLATVLNVCDNSGTWKTATASLASFAGQTVVLWFNSHDDNYPSDPTYILFDDINVH